MADSPMLVRRALAAGLFASRMLVPEASYEETDGEEEFEDRDFFAIVIELRLGVWK